MTNEEKAKEFENIKMILNEVLKGETMKKLREDKDITLSIKEEYKKKKRVYSVCLELETKATKKQDQDVVQKEESPKFEFDFPSRSSEENEEEQSPKFDFVFPKHDEEEIEDTPRKTGKKRGRPKKETYSPPPEEDEMPF